MPKAAPTSWVPPSRVHGRFVGGPQKGPFMSRLFGTDGVRGLANVDITAELALNLATAAAHVLGVMRGRRAQAQGRGQARSSCLRRVPVGGGRGGSGVRWRGRAQRRRSAHPSSGLPDRGHGCSLRGHAVGLAQCDARQRHQVLRGGRTQTGCRRGRDRRTDARHLGAADRAEVGRVHENRSRSGLPRRPPAGLPPNRLDNLTVVLDCAHGAASEVSPEVFRPGRGRRLRDRRPPDGLNINDGYGSTHLDRPRAPPSATRCRSGNRP